LTSTLPTKEFGSAGLWEKWLDAHHAESRGIWVKIAKKGAALVSVSYEDALEVALCYGWIDGQKRAFDDQQWLQKFTPRSARSVWSKINRDKATALIRARRMQPAGAREVERAKKDGRWDSAYDAQSTATVPDDLQRALAKSRRARLFFEGLDSRNRYAILYRIQDAKKAETRARRIAKFVAMLEANEKIYP